MRSTVTGLTGYVNTGSVVMVSFAGLGALNFGTTVEPNANGFVLHFSGSISLPAGSSLNFLVVSQQ